MPCYAPWTPKPGVAGNYARPLACGQCIGCRLKRSREWATRCTHENQLHQESTFITLTYNDEHLPESYNTGKLDDQGKPILAGNLDHRDFQLFLKRLRQHIVRNYPKSKTKPTKGKPPCTLSATENRFLKFPQVKGKIKINPIRYYMSGEYTEDNRRPHFHACVFGYKFKDEKPFKRTKSGELISTSEQLTKIWGKGYASTGAVTFASAAYIARYIVARITGEKAKAHYTILDADTGEFREINPEYNRMSLRPAIGRGWYDKYHSDIYPEGSVYVGGFYTTPPRYYDQLFQRNNPEAHHDLKNRRQEKANEQKEETSNTRLAAREAVHQAAAKQLRRKL